MEAILIINNLTVEKTVVKEEQFGPKENRVPGKTSSCTTSRTLAS
jgi:hypothetical protein